MWNPYQKLRSELAETEDTEFVRLFVDGEEKESIEDIPKRASETTHVVAYSENYVFYRHYLHWTGMTPMISSTEFRGDPTNERDINPTRQSPEMP